MSDTVETQAQEEEKIDTLEKLVEFTRQVTRACDNIYAEVANGFAKLSANIQSRSVYLEAFEINELISLLDNFYFENKNTDPKAMEKFNTIWSKLAPQTPADYVKGSICEDYNKKLSLNAWGLQKIFDAACELGEENIKNKLLQDRNTTLNDIVQILKEKETK